MQQKSLGRTGRTISAVGLGCVTFGREIDEDTAHRIMDHAVEKGVTFFDTAEGYGQDGASERTIGNWLRLRGARDEITLCTKVGSGGSPENIRKALARSFERLGVDSVDVYKMHSPDEKTPVGETLAAMTDEVEAGRVGAIGGSNYSAAQLRQVLDASAARGYSRFEVIQPPYNLVQTEAEDELFPLCREDQIAVTSYSPLGAGFLTGKYTSDPADVPAGTRFDVMPDHQDIYFSERNFRIVERLRDKAAKLGTPMVKLAMGFVMTNPDVTSVLVGARSTAHLDNALAVHDAGLDADLRAEMRAWGEES